MNLRCPPFVETVIISDDAQLAAQVSSVFAKAGSYLSVLDGPRLARPDSDNEVTRRNNAIARVQPDLIVLAGLSDDSCMALERQLPARMIKQAHDVSSAKELVSWKQSAFRLTTSLGS